MGQGYSVRLPRVNGQSASALWGLQPAILLLALLLQIGTVFSQTSAQLAVEIDGVGSQQEQNIRSFLSIQQLHNKTVTSRARLRYLHNQAESEILRALQPYGFYRASVTAILTQQDQNWLARYQIDPGPPLPIGQLDIQLQGDALQDQAFASLIEASTVRQGATLVHSDYENLKRQLRSLAAERGYFRAAFTQQEVVVDLGRYDARIRLSFDSGPRFLVGELRFTPGPLDIDFLQRYVPFKSGDPIQSSALIDLQTTLVDTDYFQRVEVSPLWDQAKDARVPVDINLAPNKRTKYQSGLGYGTDTGVRAKLGMTQRWVNTRGHQLNTQLLTSQIRNSLDSRYAIPGENPKLDRYAVHLSLSDENSDSIDAQNYTLGVSWQTQRRGWEQLLVLDWAEETFTFGDEEQTSNFLIPQLNLTRVKAVNRLDIRQGQRLTLQLRGASNALLSDTDFAQILVGGKWVHSLTPKLRLLGRLDAGLTLIDDFDQLPATLRFYAGGDTSVRGYDYQSLGLTDDSGDVIGGPHLVVMSAEVDYRIKPSWGVAAFVDSGNAFDDSTLRLNTGIGVGLRWFSPIGPVRLDLGFPQDGDEKDFRVHFSLGPDL
ncbi:MAG: translocation and assembly module TamA [Motiliproteus sp.]|jgi:translocation and assembly module TamA